VTQYRDRLIRIYATNSVAEIQNSAEFQTLLQQYSGDKSFQAERNRIEIAKTWVEEALEGELTEQETVQKAIKLLICLRSDPKNRALCHELIIAGHWPNWIEPRRQYFNVSWEKIKLEYDYFISFTCRYPNPETPGGNPVNAQHKHFIISKIGPDEFKKASKAENLLAIAVDRALTQVGLKRFFFPVFQYDNSKTEEKLANACDNSLVFFQLVEPIMFHPLAGGLNNYCYNEWQRVYNRLRGTDAEENILYLIVVADRHVFADVSRHPGYSDWYNHIANKDSPYLPETPTRNASALDNIKRIFDQKLRPEIKGAWNRLIEGVP
jgi:hypothetical protein